MKVPYKNNPILYRDHFLQDGGSYPVFQGYMTQSGYGIGNLISSLSRVVIPLLRKTVTPLVSKGIQKAIPIVKHSAKHLGKHALQSGMKSLVNISQKKQTPRQAISSAKREIAEHMSDMLAESLPKSKKRKGRSNKKGGSKRIKSDIFS